MRKILSIKYVYYLFEGESYMGEGYSKKKRNPPSVGSLPKWQQWPGLS